MFEELPYTSKIKVCEIFYLETIDTKLNFLLPKMIYFSWGKITIETLSGDVLFNTTVIKNWYENNIQIIRKHKLLSITKRELIVS